MHQINLILPLNLPQVSIKSPKISNKPAFSPEVHEHAILQTPTSQYRSPHRHPPQKPMSYKLTTETAPTLPFFLKDLIGVWTCLKFAVMLRFAVLPDETIFLESSPVTSMVVVAATAASLGSLAILISILYGRRQINKLMHACIGEGPGANVKAFSKHLAHSSRLPKKTTTTGQTFHIIKFYFIGVWK